MQSVTPAAVAGGLRRRMLATTDVDLAPLRVAGAAMLAFGAILPHVPGNPGLPCPLRFITGVPCPFCGCTTAVEAVMQANFGSALAASPLGVVAAGVAMLLLLRPRWSGARVAVLPWLAVVALSWVFQLGRFGFL